jgi:hypothetical protein
MTRLSSLVALLAFWLLTGCVQSLHPYFTADQVTYDPVLVGTWANDDGDSVFVVTGDAESKTYHVAFTDEEKKTGKFDVHLVKAQDQQLLDITAAETDEQRSDMYRVHLLPVHSFMLFSRKEGENDAIELRTMEYDWLKKYLEQNPKAVAHEVIGGDRILLTAPSEKVQAFVLEHAKAEGAYGEPGVFKRVKSATTAPAPATQP